MRDLIAIAVAALLTACGLQPSAQPPLRPLAPLSAGESRQLMQHITVTWGGKKKDLLSASLLGPELLKVSLLTPEGISLLDIHYDGREVRAQQYLGKNRQIPPRALVADIQLVYWPLELLQVGLPAQWELREENTSAGLRRQLFFAGEPHTEVSYSGDDIWTSEVQLEQKSLGYSLRIKNL